MTPPTRELNEMHLEWLRLADAGVSRREIGRRYGRTEGTVKNFMGAVRRDLKASEVGSDPRQGGMF